MKLRPTVRRPKRRAAPTVTAASDLESRESAVVQPARPRPVEIVGRLLRACGADPGAPEWRQVHAALVREARHIWSARRRTARLPPWPGDSAFSPMGASIEHPGGALPSHPDWRRASLGLALDLAQVLSGTSGRGRRPDDPARRELREALRDFRVEGAGPAVGPTDESRKRDRWVEQHAAGHHRVAVNREDFRALLRELKKGQSSYLYRFDEDGFLTPCDPDKSWQQARDLYAALGGDTSRLPDKPRRYSRRGTALRYENAAAIDDLEREYRRRRAMPQGGAPAVSVLADLERAAGKLAEGE